MRICGVHPSGPWAMFRIARITPPQTEILLRLSYLAYSWQFTLTTSGQPSHLSSYKMYNKFTYDTDYNSTTARTAINRFDFQYVRAYSRFILMCPLRTSTAKERLTV